jgi:hypothetical protein
MCRETNKLVGQGDGEQRRVVHIAPQLIDAGEDGVEAVQIGRTRSSNGHRSWDSGHVYSGTGCPVNYLTTIIGASAINFSSHMAWEHVDLNRSVWLIPSEHSKNGKPHIVHLSDEAVSLLGKVPRAGKLVFSLDGVRAFQGYSKAKKRLDCASGVGGWTLHDLRRTVVSGMARLGVAPHVADKILNHQSGTISGVAAVYQRHEFMNERKEALSRWGQHIGKLIASQADSSDRLELGRAA